MTKDELENENSKKKYNSARCIRKEKEIRSMEARNAGGHTPFRDFCAQRNTYFELENVSV